jgi:hypothetical protein
MRPILATTGAAMAVTGILALAAVTPAAKRAPAPQRCGKPHARTLAATKDARITTSRVRSERAVFACRYRTGKLVRLGYLGEESCSGGQVLDFALAGRFAAAVIYDCTSTVDAAGVVEVRDLARGRLTSQTVAGSFSEVLLLDDGTAAFVGIAPDRPISSGPGPGAAFVGYLPPGGQRVELAVAAPGEIVTGSLALAGRTLYWTQTGVPRSAQIP